MLDYAWLIPVVPAVSAGVLLLFGKRIGRPASVIAVGAIGVSAVLSTLVFLELRGLEEGSRSVLVNLGPWIHAGPLQVDWELLLDPLSSVMLLLVTWVGLLIHVYSLGYMSDDEHYARFFAYLNLFAASMLILVLGSSFLVLFVGWELVGLSSYLLIGFWFERRDYAGAAKKAFLLNRIADVGFMVAMFVVFSAFGSLAFADVLPNAEAVLGAGSATAVAIALLLFAGATGKSAQIPLYVWLPDAMAGPTPVSALIHAATMVTAGVYLVARTSAIFALVPDIGLVVAYVGAATALVAALIACAQVDLKKILAYSTVSQLGYMFIGVGVGDQVAGIFHLLTHGAFKALLFLAAGSVLHALHDRADVRSMGGLLRVMPVTAITSAIACLAIIGFPFTSGFYSKEEILAAALETPGAQGAWLVGVVVAGLTAFYVSRWFILVFLGRPRWAGAQAEGSASDDAHPHESPASMTLPLVVLAVGAAAGGLLNLDPEAGFLHRWLEPSVTQFRGETAFLSEAVAVTAILGISLVGVAFAAARYLRLDADLAADPRGWGAIALRAFNVDRFYEQVVLAPGAALARLSAATDRIVIDGAVNGIARGTVGLATAGRALQTGFVRSYALAVLAGVVAVTALFLSAVVR